MGSAGKIKIDELRQFVKTEIYPCMNKDWAYFQSDAGFARFCGFSLQRIAFSEFRYGLRFRVYYALQSLAHPTPFLHVVIGDTLKDSSDKKLFGLFPQRSREAWFDWDARMEKIDYLMSLLAEQVSPNIAQPLTLENMLESISKYLPNATHPNIPWTAGIILGELGRFAEARQSLLDTIEIYSKGIEELKELVKTNEQLKEKCLRWTVELKQAQEMLNSLHNSEAFNKHCNKIVTANIRTMNIPTR
ncbi:hypothetical protein [Methylicorpusculum sp.]|uniref:hypothetical protein n=1 Tax=Methylicorpusculum sp. TaxID=2713644 RepID=UPI002ABAF5E0|nr:hypothetical protein [Methylicorpusculum sp.]MDZ4150171.1 hypothetical protein [Methylicorpusculum sp.]